MTAPLTALECELLEAITRERDDAALAVLGDYWIEQVDEARGAFVHLHLGDNVDRMDLAEEEARLAAFAHRWREPLVRAGYAERDLALASGFLQWPLAVPAGHPFDGDPDVVRISPRYYREHAVLRDGVECTVIEAEAITPRTRTRVALKAARCDDYRDVIEHEHAMLARVAHRNVVRVIDQAVRVDGRALVLEWCGTDVRALVRSARRYQRLLGIDFAISVGVQLCDALTAIHAARMIHREVRADHVAIGADGTVRLIDFGSATCLDGESFDRWGRYISPGYHGDEMRRRVQYMSPEQCRGLPLDESTDVFSLAGVIVELATNRHPVGTCDSAFAAIERIVRTQLEPPPSLPPQLQLALRPAFDGEPSRRPSPAQLRAMLIAAARSDRIAIGPDVIARRLVELGVPA